MNHQSKAKYSKPQITKVALRPDEAALTNCKTATSSGIGCRNGGACGSKNGIGS